MDKDKRCPDCDRLLATDDDDATYPQGGGEHLCWRRFANDTCEGDPVDWRARCKKREREIERLRRWRTTLRTLAVFIGVPDPKDMPSAIYDDIKAKHVEMRLEIEEQEREIERHKGLLHDALERSRGYKVRAETAESERDALREQIEEVRRRMKKCTAIYLPDGSIDKMIDGAILTKKAGDTDEIGELGCIDGISEVVCRCRRCDKKASE